MKLPLRVWFSGRTRPCQGRDGSSILPTRTVKTAGFLMWGRASQLLGLRGESNAGAMFFQQKKQVRRCPEKLLGRQKFTRGRSP